MMRLLWVGGGETFNPCVPHTEYSDGILADDKPLEGPKPFQPDTRGSRLESKLPVQARGCHRREKWTQ
jgi:hypothetical protein